MASARYTIDGDPSENLGYDATNGQVLTLQLENLPATDVDRVQYSVTAKSKDAPAPTFSPVSGEPATPGGTVDVTMPGSDTHSYAIECVVNNGVDASGVAQASYRFTRIIAIRNSSDIRKMVPGERTEYDATNGWTEVVNDLVDATDGISPPGPPTAVTGPRLGGPNTQLASILSLLVAKGLATDSTTSPVRAVTGTDTATTADIVLLCDPTGGSFTETLFDATSHVGHPLCIFHYGTSNTVIVDPHSSQRINGISTPVTLQPGDGLFLCSVGSDGWVTQGFRIPPDALATAHTLARRGASAELLAAWFAGTGTVADSGVFRAANNVTALAARDNAAGTIRLARTDGSNHTIFGDATTAANAELAAGTGNAILSRGGTAQITCASGVTTLHANAVEVAGQLSCAPEAPAYAATVDLDFSRSNHQEPAALTNNVTFTFSNLRPGAEYTIMVKQDATGGRTATWPAAAKFIGSADGSLNPVANAYTLFKGYSAADGNLYLYAATLEQTFTITLTNGEATKSTGITVTTATRAFIQMRSSNGSVQIGRPEYSLTPGAPGVGQMYIFSNDGAGEIQPDDNSILEVLLRG